MIRKKIQLRFVIGFLLLAVIACNYPSAAPDLAPLAATPTPPPTPYQHPLDYSTPTPFIPRSATGVSPTEESQFAEVALPPAGVPPAVAEVGGKENINYLLIGKDVSSAKYFRTDTMIIVSLRPRDRSVSMISIPRDLYVYIPGRDMNRINTAYLYGELDRYEGGGTALLKETIRYNLGLRIDHIAMVDFKGFSKIVDTLGGIDVPLVCPYRDWHIKNPNRSEQDPNNWELFSVGPGLVHMDGDLALWYARSRLRSNDFDRGRRQQEVLRSLYTAALRGDVIPRLPELYNQFRDTVSTDLTLGDLLALVPLAAQMNSASIRSYYINNHYVNSWRTPGGASVLLPKEKKIGELLDEALGPPPPEKVESQHLLVEIHNATSQADWGSLAAERLHYAGYRALLRSDFPASAGPTPGEGETLLFDLTPDQDPSRSARLLASLGLSTSRLRSAPMSSGAPFLLVLGNDYSPCFNPARLP